MGQERGRVVGEDYGRLARLAVALHAILLATTWLTTAANGISGREYQFVM